MKNVTLLSIVTATLLAAGCSTMEPVPVGDELVWSSEDKVPEWTKLPGEFVDDVDNLGESYHFVGISARHSSERIARESAITNATVQAARFIRQQVEQDQLTLTEGSSRESGVSDLEISVRDEIHVKTQSIMQRVNVADLYTQHWEKNGQMFFKTYALVRIPVKDVKYSQHMANEKERAELEHTRQATKALAAASADRVDPESAASN